MEVRVNKRHADLLERARSNVYICRHNPNTSASIRDDLLDEAMDKIAIVQRAFERQSEAKAKKETPAPQMSQGAPLAIEAIKEALIYMDDHFTVGANQPSAYRKALDAIEALVPSFPAPPAHANIERFIVKLMRERRNWADSPEGRKELGPGSPAIPGLQDMQRILKFVQTGKDDTR